MNVLKAGQELDSLVAEEVMGEPKPTDPVPKEALQGILEVPSAGGNWIGTTSGYDSGDVPEWRPLPFSTNISAGWKVVEKLQADRIELLLEWDAEDEEWFASFGIYNPVAFSEHLGDPGIAPTAPYAICLAAIRAIRASSGNGK